MTYRMLRSKRTVSVLLLLTLAFVLQGAATPPPDNRGEQLSATQLPGRIARVTQPNGLPRTVTLDGVGCSMSMCSRVVIKGKDTRGKIVGTPLDSIASITVATKDMAVLVMKDGTERNVTLVPDFRVLYVTDRSGVNERIDLAKIRSVEFLATDK